MTRRFGLFDDLAAACLVAFWLFSSVSLAFGDLTARDFAVELTAVVAENPAQIILSWRPDPNASSYGISRKLLSENAWTPLVAVDGNASTFADNSVQPGVAYEYQVIKTTSAGYPGYGYICSAIARHLVDTRGKVVLLVEQTLAQSLNFELARLQQDLVGDGWIVLRHDVAASDSVSSVKDLVRADYQSDPDNVKSLFLFGHVPVPYSGDIAPDGHPNHQGAWPADVYYGEFDGAWTDTSVNATGAADRFNWNVPGDGKFDQSVPPGPVRLGIGRVDLSNLTCFANKLPSKSELDLARQYLQKDHNFRHGLLNMERRGLIYDNRGVSEEDPLCATPWRAFPGFFGSDHVTEIGANQYFSTLQQGSYLWSYCCSSGNFVGSDYIGWSDDFALNDPKVIFTSFLGSYFGDWNRESSFLRAPLGTASYVLTCIYGGQPQWILHTMALGETIGYSANLTQNNSTNGIYVPHKNFGVGQVHIALMGDPTLRLHPVIPPGNLAAAPGNKGWTLTWRASQDPEIAGYMIYRSASPAGPFIRISGDSPRTETAFQDPSGASDFNYMVRAIKLEHSASGTYYNASQGIFFPDPIGAAAGQAPATPTGLVVTRLSSDGVTLGWIESSANTSRFTVERRALPGGSFEEIPTRSGNSLECTDPSVHSGVYGYRVKAANANGESAYSQEVIANLQSGTATFIKVDAATQGNWPGVYGQDGYLIVSAATNLPPYAEMDALNVMEFISQWWTDDVSALARPEGVGRISATWFDSRGGAVSLSLRFSDHAVHRVALYFFDGHSGVRTGRVEVSDPLSGQVLASQDLADYSEGKYWVFDISDTALIRIIPGTIGNAIVNGIFFSTPPVDTPVITPAGGIFPGKTTVNIASTPGATIHFTMDGSVPDANSPVFQAPFELRSNATIAAKAFKDGYVASAVSFSSYTNSLISEAQFVSTDTSTAGDWPGRFGQEAFWVIDGASQSSPLVDPSFGTPAAYLWSDSTTEVRAIRRSPQDSTRLAACWYAADELSFDLTIYDQRTHPLALYFMDWDHNGRVQQITISSPDGAILDQRQVEQFDDGKYLIWNAKGGLRITLKNLKGNNVMLNGLFVGPEIVPPISTAPATLASAKLGSDGYHIQVIGEPGQTFTIEASSDFITWLPLETQTLVNPVWDFVDRTAITNNERLYRARLNP